MRRSSSRSLRRGELVGDERREEVDRRHAFGLGLEQAGFEDGGHAAEAELAQGALSSTRFIRISLVFWLMRSR